MKKYFIFFILLSFVASCNLSGKKVVTYKDAENVFLKSLTEKDTATVLSMTDSFMNFLLQGQIDSAIQLVQVVYGDTLYMPSLGYKLELCSRFYTFPVVKYELVRYSFSTEGNNDVCYKYWFDEQQNHTMKVVFNPVKIDSQWYITMKDGTQSSKDLNEQNQVHPMSPAPNKIVLNNCI